MEKKEEKVLEIWKVYSNKFYPYMLGIVEKINNSSKSLSKKKV